MEIKLQHGLTFYDKRITVFESSGAAFRGVDIWNKADYNPTKRYLKTLPTLLQLTCYKYKVDNGSHYVCYYTSLCAMRSHFFK